MLTDAQIRKAKAGAKPYKLADGQGLHLYVAPSGSKSWRMRYEFGGKEKLLSIGPYPAVSLAGARAKRDEAKSDLREGRDPSLVKKQKLLTVAAQGEETFEAIAREWYKLNQPTWAARHAADVITSLERDVFPKLGKFPIRDITAPQTLSVLREIESRPAVETARRIRQRMSAVFVFAIASGRADNDPAAIVKGAMAPVIRRRQPAITKLEDVREVLKRAEAEPAHPVTKLALRLLALTALRPGALITTPWSEFNGLDKVEPTWTVPAARMKMRVHFKDDENRDHLVPLSRQAVDAIEAVRALTGRGPIVFPNVRHAHRPMSENAIGYLLNRAGYHHQHVPHGWRATFSTIMNERYPQDSRIIDLMLAHSPKDRVEGAYNRAAHLARRRELAQEWADLLMVGQLPVADLLAGPRR